MSIYSTGTISSLDMDVPVVLSDDGSVAFIVMVDVAHEKNKREALRPRRPLPLILLPSWVP